MVDEGKPMTYKRKKKLKKKMAKYEKHELFEHFQAYGGHPPEKEKKAKKKKNWLMAYGMVPDFLKSQGYEPQDADADYEIDKYLDRDFRGEVRYKDFLKFFKKWRKGSLEASDSSMSSSEEYDEFVRKEFRIMDPQRMCRVEVVDFVLYKWKLYEDKERIGDRDRAESEVPIAKIHWDFDKDGYIGFKDFARFWAKHADWLETWLYTNRHHGPDAYTKRLFPERLN